MNALGKIAMAEALKEGEIIASPLYVRETPL